MDMKRYAYVLALSVAAPLVALTGCGDSDSSPNTPKDDPNTEVQMDSVKTVDDLPSCTEKREEKVSFIEDDSSIRICLDEKWEEAEDVAAIREDLPNCSDKRNGVSAYVLDEHGFLTCTEGRWKSESTSDEKSSSSKKTDKSSSSTEKNSSGNEKVSSAKDESSSSAEAKSSSSEKEEKSSSSSKDVKPAKASLTATIYDTDASLHPLFSCDVGNHGLSAGEGCQTGAQGVDAKTAVAAVNACFGVIQGAVETTLGENKKPTLAEDGKACFIDEKYFNQLFNYTEGVNEVTAWEMPFEKNEDGLWGFNSDTVHTAGDVGGFFPVENTTDNDIIAVNGIKQGPTLDARTVRKADGPFFISDTIDFYHYCNSAGWTGGRECNGLFANGDTPSLWNWVGVSRWTGNNRNQHFCMEIHGSFTYSDSLEAAFSANGDQWVFIGNKLAVDNGGNHVNAPSFVQLKTLNKTYSSYMKEGKDYPIDIFFCARRTTMSGFSIQTNFPIKQN